MKTNTPQTTATHVAPFTSFIRATSKATRKAAFLLFSVAMLLAGVGTTVRGQSALDGFDPNANGTIRVIVVQPDGKILIGGDFTTVLGVTRNHIARLNPDGTLDTAFDPNADGNVLTFGVQTDGKILVGGIFGVIGGQVRSCIARLDPVTGLADSWNPNATSTTAHNGVNSILVQEDGKVLAGGDFTSIGGQIRNGLARLDAATGVADTWNPNANGDTVSLAIQTDGKILVAGGFGVIGGQARAFIARLDPVTGLADSWNPNPNDVVFSIAVQADGKVLAGGQFTSIGGQTRIGIARLDAVTGAADTWNTNASANSVVLSVAIQSDGKILAGGNFFNIGGQTRNDMARLDSVTGLADSFDPSANSFVLSIAIQQDGKILAGGQFTTLTPNGGAPVTRNHIARLETNGGIDRTLDLAAVGTIVLTTAVQSDGKILIGGDFTSVLGVTRNKIARLNADGTLDMAFNPNAANRVFGIAVQPDGKIIAAGEFTAIGGQTRFGIARLDPVTGAADSWDPFVNGWAYEIALQTDGKIVVGGNFSAIGGQQRSSIARLDAVTGLADSFNPGVGGEVKSIAIQPDGKILVGGPFSMMGGQARSGIARLDPVTGLADSWDPSASSGNVFTIAVQPDGKILVGGNFDGIGGQPRNYIARLDAVTGLADSWNPNADNEVNAISVQADGRVLASGNFNTIGGQARNRIARVDGLTGLADSFDPNANARVETVAVLPDGKILAGGIFTSIGGQPRSTFARLSNDTAALQTLAVTPTTVTWTRGGSSSQFVRVSFEQSTDNVSYTSLGNGTASGSDWTLTGLSFPTNQNFYVRAHGYYRSGYQNGSESITESVRNAIFVPPTITSANNTAFIVSTPGAFSVTTTGIPTGTSMLITESGTLPGGVTFVDNNNGTATLAGTPNAGTAGSYPITITASNGVSPNATQNFILAVDEAPRINSANSTTFTVGSAGTFNVTTDRGFPAPVLSETGSLPGGVSFTNNGNGTATLAGNPVPGSGGVYALTITASNGVSPNATQNFTLTINETRVVSRKIHGGAPRDITLPLTGASGIECRSGGAANDYQVVFTFDSAITFNSAAVTAGAGSVSSSSGSGTTIVTVNLTGVSTAQTITVKLFSVNNGGDLPVQMSVLVGDTTGDGTVNASDVSQTKMNSGQVVDASNFRTDVNVSGSINATDIALVKANSGGSRPLASR